MGNYSLAVNSTFQPFTYQELAAPLDRQELYHEKLAEEYDKLSTQADVLEAMGQNDRDKRGGAYDRYKAYSDALRKEADDLYRHGLNVESRQRLSNLRRRYNTEIVPIQNAWTKRQEEADIQLKARLQNPELRFTRDAINTDLDEYIRNPQGGFNVVNLDKVYSDMYAASKNLAKQARERRIEGIDAYNDLLITPYGLDPNQVRDWMSNPNASPTLTNMLGAVLEKHGLTREEFLNTPNGRSILEEATNAAKNGAWGAVGEDRENILENFENRTKYKYNVEHPETQYSPDMRPYITVSEQMPLILGDSKDRKQAEKYATTLGFRAGGGNGYYDTTLNPSLFSEGKKAIQPTTYSPVSERPSDRIVRGKKLFNTKTNKMLSEEEFVAQGGNDAAKSSLRNWYRNNVTPALEYFGFSAGDTPSSKEFQDAYSKRYASGAAGYISGIDITHSNAEDWRKMGSSNAYPVKSYNRKSGMRADSNAVKLSTILDNVKGNKGNINKTVVTNYQGKPALLFEYQEGNNIVPYSVPLDMGNSAIRKGFEQLQDAEYYEQVAKTERSLNNEQRNKLLQQAKDLMDAGLGNINNSLVTYSRPNVNTYKQPNETDLRDR